MNAKELINELGKTGETAAKIAAGRIAASSDLELLAPLEELSTPGSPEIEILFCRYLGNLPHYVSLPRMEKLFNSPNKGTRESAWETLGTIPDRYKYGILRGLLACPHEDVLKPALEKIAMFGKQSLVVDMEGLLSSPERAIRKAAIAAIAAINTRNGVYALLKCLEAEDDTLRIDAVFGLGAMPCFRNWRKLAPIASSGSKDVRMAAVVTMAKKGGGGAGAFLLRRLKQEEDPRILKFILGRIGENPDVEAAMALLTAAANSEAADVRRTAAWLVDSIYPRVCMAAMKKLLRKGDNALTAFILTTMGSRRLSGAGEIIGRYAAGKNSPLLLNAAIEALGMLGDRRRIAAVSAYIASQDPMTAYVATLASTQLAENISDCPALFDVLRSDEESADVLKQVALQSLLDSRHETITDSSLLEILKKNMLSPNTNVRYISIMLAARCPEPGVPPMLIDAALNEADTTIRKAARESLSSLLDGDMTVLLRELGRMKSEQQINGHIGLLADLDWSEDSACKAVGILCGLELENVYRENRETMDRIADIVFGCAPQAVRDSFSGAPVPGAWNFAIGMAVLRSISSGQSARARNDWQIVFNCGIPELAAAAAKQAALFSSAWAADSILDRIAAGPETPLASELRPAMKKLLKL